MDIVGIKTKWQGGKYLALKIANKVKNSPVKAKNKYKFIIHDLVLEGRGPGQNSSVNEKAEISFSRSKTNIRSHP